MNIGLVVEGHGEVQAAPVLLRRVLYDLLQRYDVTVTRPVRMSRSRTGESFPDLDRQVRLAATDAEAVLVIFDADDDCPAELAPQLLARASIAAGDVPVAVVLATREYEAWFLAAIESLRGKCGVRADAVMPDAPEFIRNAKGRLQDLMEYGAYYSETVDQARLSGAFDLAEAQARSRSFNKLCRDVARLVGTDDESTPTESH